MQLSVERRARIQQRLEPILRAIDPELRFIAVFVDSSREYLGIVVQLRDRPLLLKFGWVDFISRSDDSLRQEVSAQLGAKLAHQGSNHKDR